MSAKRKRPSLAVALDVETTETAPRDNVVTASRDNVVPLPALADEVSAEAYAAPKRKPGGVRDTYHATVYLPEEASFALREIALMKRYQKPHTVMLEAMAVLFDSYNKGALAAQIREQMRARDNGIT